MKTKPEVGQILYSLNVGNAARRCEQVLTPVKVTKVGNKYFTCEKVDGWFRTTQYRISDWSENIEYNATSQLYMTEDEWLTEKDRSQMISKIKTYFSAYGNITLTNDELRLIVEVIK